MKLGIMQGRLTRPVDGQIQEFPYKDWMAEFIALRKLNLNHVEWVVTKSSFKKNPVFSNNYQLYTLPINSICADNLVDERITNLKFLKKQLIPICESAIRNGVSSITIPLLEESSLVHRAKRKEFSKNIKEVTDQFSDSPLSFTFEAELGIDELHEIVSLSNKFFVTYDTGNITSFGLNHEEYIFGLQKKINNIHLKDRTHDARTVSPGEGDTDFKSIFDALQEINYNSTYTIQTAREEPGMELETITKHKNYFEEIFNEKLI